MYWEEHFEWFEENYLPLEVSEIDEEFLRLFVTLFIQDVKQAAKNHQNYSETDFNSIEAAKNVYNCLIFYHQYDVYVPLMNKDYYDTEQESRGYAEGFSLTEDDKELLLLPTYSNIYKLIYSDLKVDGTKVSIKISYE